MSSEQTLDKDLLQLASAFNTFNEVSRELETSYGTLEVRMTELQQQLTRTDEKRRAEEERGDHLAARLKLLLETLPGAVALVDGDGIVKELNTSAEHLLGDDAVGRCWATLTTEVFEPELSPQGDLISRSGTKLSLAQRKLESDSGTVLLLTDVTGKREVEEVLARHQRLAALGEMVATLAHQVRTPVTSALLYASNALRPELADKRRRKLVEKTIGCLHDLEDLVTDMLRFARGNSESQADTFDIADLLASIRVAVGPLAQRDQEVEIREPAQDLRLRGNRAALAGAIQNLVVNALQAARGAAHVIVEAGRQDDSASSEMVQIRVSDDGPGIEPALCDRIFEPFFTGRSDGTGLGLAVARSIVRSHHGELRLDTAQPVGACFVVTLPLATDSNLLAHTAAADRATPELETA